MGKNTRLKSEAHTAPLIREMSAFGGEPRIITDLRFIGNSQFGLSQIGHFLRSMLCPQLFLSILIRVEAVQTAACATLRGA